MILAASSAARFNKNKTFFFFSHEGLRLHQPSTQQTAVPDAASRQQAPPSMRPYLNAYPLPNGPALGPGLAEFNASFSNPSTLDAYSIRVDHVVSSKLNAVRPLQLLAVQLRPTGWHVPVRASAQHDEFGFIVRAHSHGRRHTTDQRTIQQRSASELQQPSQWASSTRWTISAERCRFRIPCCFPPGTRPSDSGFLLLISGAGQYAQGKIGTDEQRQVNLVDNLSVIKGQPPVEVRRGLSLASPRSAAHSPTGCSCSSRE